MARETSVTLKVKDGFSRQFHDFQAGLDKSTHSAKSFGTRMGEAFGGIAKAAPLAGVAIAGFAIKAGMQMEQTRMAFTQLTGSAANAQKHLEDLRAFAATTPFQFTELTEASRRLMAFGFEAEKVIPMLTDIGDAVAAMGGSAEMVDRVTLAIGQMSAKSKVSAGEMLQLTEAGIPAWKYLADAMGLSTAQVMKLSEKGLIPAGKAIDHILKGMREDFGGMMEEQSKTAAGQMSNLVDTLEEMATTIGEMALPAVKAFFGVMKQGLDVLKQVVTWERQTTAVFKEHQSAMFALATAQDETRISVRDYNEEVIRSGKLTGDVTVWAKEGQNALLDQASAVELSRQGLVKLGDTYFLVSDSVRLFTEDALGAFERAMADTASSADEGKRALAAMAKTVKEEVVFSEAELAKQAEAAAKELAKQEEILRKVRDASSDAAKGFFGLAQSYVDGVTKMDLVKRGLDALDQAQRSGIITDAERRAAQERIMLQYDLVTEKALSQARAEQELTRMFNLGALSIDEYMSALVLIPQASKDGRVGMEELGGAAGDAAARLGEAEDKARRATSAINDIPKETEITVTTIYRQITEQIQETAGTLGGRQHGGPVFRGRPYLIGEAGPEIFVPERSGFVVNQQQAAQAAASMPLIGSITVNNPAAGMDVGGLMRDIEFELARRARAMRQAGAAILGT